MRNAPSTSKAIEQAWSAELAAHFGVPEAAMGEQVRPWFDFPPDLVRVELMDGSMLELKYAFHLVNESRHAVALFTEHCGHFVVPSHGARVFVNGYLVYQQHSA